MIRYYLSDPFTGQVKRCALTRKQAFKKKGFFKIHAVDQSQLDRTLLGQDIRWRIEINAGDLK